MAERRVVQLVYRSGRATEPISRDVHPRGWIFHPKNSAVYLMAYAPDHGEDRLYKLDRVESAFVTDLRFPKREEFSPAEFLAGALGVYRGHADGKPTTVRVRFHPSAARFVNEKRWHVSQTLRPQPDGSLIAEYRLTSLVEIKSWLLSWGRRVEVLAPPALITDLRTEAAALHEMYSPSAGTVVQASQLASRRPAAQPDGGPSKPRKPRPR
jgi:predicted DNA-binding transcriptional regulator YafY